MLWKPESDTVGQEVVYDQSPNNEYSFTEADAYADRNVEAVDGAADNLCTQEWDLEGDFSSCVTFTATVKRLMTTTDTTSDIPLVYSTYTMNALAGTNTAIDGANAVTYRFPTESVDFQYFLLEELPEAGAMAGVAVGAAVGVSLAAMLF